MWGPFPYSGKRQTSFNNARNVEVMEADHGDRGLCAACSRPGCVEKEKSVLAKCSVGLWTTAWNSKKALVEKLVKPE